jgi:FkbM family methyltransferase
MVKNFKQKIRTYLLNRLSPQTAPECSRTAYSQEGEDVCLFRIINPSIIGTGTYVDVGCNHPWLFSNTAAFYEIGWRGIVIDPNPEFEKMYAIHRPDDIFLNLGVSNEKDNLKYYKFTNSLYNTFSGEVMKQNVELKLVDEPQEVIVAVDTLSNILEKIWPDGHVIDLMSVDAEGLDFKIIQGHDFVKFPVKYLIIEIDVATINDIYNISSIQYLLERGFVPVSKLWKSVILFHADEFAKYKFC